MRLLSTPPPPLLPSPVQPFSIEILSSPSSSFEPVPTYPSSLPLHVERSKPVLATTTTTTTTATTGPPHVAPVVITSIHFTLKAGAGALSRNEPRASRIFATDCHTLVHLPPQPFSKFARLQQGRRGGRRVDSSSDSGLGLVSSSRIFPREAKISMTLPPHLVHG